MHHSKSFSPPFHPVEGAAGSVASGGETSPDFAGAETPGERLARLRKHKLLTQSELARLLGVTVTSVCYWEQDRSRPKAARLEALATLLGVPVAELIADAAPERRNLQSLVARMRSQIASAAGTSPAKVRIVIEM